MQIIKKYFNELQPGQLDKLSMMGEVYADWNQKINLVSRKDMDFFYIRHVLHSLAIYRYCPFLPGARVLDVGTGGGFPGIPLAICCPDTQFVLIDSIGKKIRVVNDIARQLKLDNVATRQVRAERMTGTFDFIVSRAVTSLPVFFDWVSDKISHVSRHALPNGILYLKGGNLDAELAPLDWQYRVTDLAGLFEEDFFQTKKIIHLYEK